MTVRKADRHASKSECLNKTRTLLIYLTNATKPPERIDGEQISKGGFLGSGQPYYAYGKDFMDYAKHIYEVSYKGLSIYIKNEETYQNRQVYLKEAIEDCASIFRLIDLALFQYKNSKKKTKSLKYIAKMTHEVKHSITDRMNRDKMILQGIQQRKKS